MNKYTILLLITSAMTGCNDGSNSATTQPDHPTLKVSVCNMINDSSIDLNTEEGRNYANDNTCIKIVSDDLGTLLSETPTPWVNDYLSFNNRYGQGSSVEEFKLNNKYTYSYSDSGSIFGVTKFGFADYDDITQTTSADQGYGSQAWNWCETMNEYKVADRDNWKLPQSVDIFNILNSALSNDETMRSMYGWTDLEHPTIDATTGLVTLFDYSEKAPYVWDTTQPWYKEKSSTIKDGMTVMLRSFAVSCVSEPK
ncbi:hypothetical protein AAFX60_008715 [Aliivibrio fischeri]|uniref:hypothetical protein n=1 Tax=Aliivibrio fischeri TaxID=668 RepID=UPI000A96A1C1|nr:hypothetical protein [Aliivibrio fischeri]